MEAYSDDWLRYIMPGMELFVDRIGEGRPLVFLHGNPVDHRIHLPMDGAIAQVGGWERWYLDLPGFGRSPLPDNVTSSQTMAEALVTWLVSTLRDKPFALVGSSFGGLMARYVANHMPNQVSGLGLICPLVTADRAKRRLPPFRLAQVDQDLAAKVPAADWAEYAEMAVIQSPQGWEGFRRYILPALRADSAAVVGRLARSYDL
ncbi:MAG: alpha/beta hydrolase, partial [Micrococcales bacterium]|nr:alpha/beta hydrolase [Micrococcales bacterium]